MFCCFSASIGKSSAILRSFRIVKMVQKRIIHSLVYHFRRFPVM